MRFNSDYLKIAREIPLLFSANFLKKREVAKTSKRLLLVHAGLIGDFVICIPAIKRFILKNKDFQVDLLVSPSVEKLAERIEGVGNIYLSRSHGKREAEEEKLQNRAKNTPSGLYREIIVLRISEDAYKILRKVRFWKIKTFFLRVVKYWGELSFDFLSGKKSKQLRTFFSELLGESEENFAQIEKVIKLQDFNLSERLGKKISPKYKIIAIHTSTVWKMKNWDNKNWIKLLNKIDGFGNFKIVFVGERSGELEDFKEISKGLKFRAYSLINKLTILELLSFLSKIDYFIGIDSGPRHLVHLADKRSIVLWGNGLDIYLPPNQKDILINKAEHGRLIQLFFSTKKSNVNKITVEEVFSEFKKLLASSTTDLNKFNL